MIFPGFVGGTYQSMSPFLSREECINLYLESLPANGATQAALFGTPGLKLFANIPDSPSQGMIEIAGRAFAIVGGALWELFLDGTFINRGQAGSLTPGVSMANSGKQLIMACGANGYCFDLTSNKFTQIQNWPGGQSITFLDGYFILANLNSRQFNISALNDGTSWDALDFATKEGAADNITCVVAIRKQLWLLGAETSEVWWDNGNNNFPFAPLQGALLQQGSASYLGPKVVGNQLYWLGFDPNGGAIVYTEQNFVPVRVSTYAVEQEIGKYSTINDAVGMTYTEGGHAFYLLHFPSASVTWALDTGNGVWHKRGYWDTTIGQYTASLGRFHCYAFGKHLVADYRSGQIYQQSLTFLDDNGNPIRRLRRSPHIEQEDSRVKYSRLELLMQRGFAQQTGNDAIPMLMMRYSNDGGMTFSSERMIEAGREGQYGHRAIWRQCGRGRNRVFEISSTSGIQHVWLNAFLRASGGTELQPSQ